MTDRIRQRLIKAAREKQTISYTQLNDDCELGFNFNLGQDRDAIGDLLGEISEWEFDRNRPLLSSLVRHKNGKHEQGVGFYRLCEYLGFGDRKKLENDLDFELEHINRCFSFWKDDRNYQDFKKDF